MYTEQGRKGTHWRLIRGLQTRAFKRFHQRQCQAAHTVFLTLNIFTLWVEPRLYLKAGARLLLIIPPLRAECSGYAAERGGICNAITFAVV